MGELPAILSQGFVAPSPGKDDGHHGIDLAHYVYKDKTSIAGAPVQALFAGRVAAAIGGSWPYGNFVIVESEASDLPAGLFERFSIDPDYSLYHLYAHFEAAPDLLPGESLPCGAQLGTVGNSGWSGNYHLHLETRFGPPGISYSEMAYYLTTTTQGARDSYEDWRMGAAFYLLDPLELLGLAP